MTRLNLAGEVRARRGRRSRRGSRRAVTPARLRAAMHEIRALKAQLAAVRDTAAMAARVVTPTVRSAMECLRLERGGTETDVGENALAETTNAGSAPSTMRTPRRSIAVRVAEAEAEAARRVLDAATRRARRRRRRRRPRASARVEDAGGTSLPRIATRPKRVGERDEAIEDETKTRSKTRRRRDRARDASRPSPSPRLVRFLFLHDARERAITSSSQSSPRARS